MAEEILEEYYEELAMGRWQSVAALDVHEQLQVIVYATGKNAQWLTQLEQRTQS